MSVPALGFGTAPILGRVGKRRSISALEHAFTLGVRHFDTARSYGWGEAEPVLGRFLSKYPRSSYTLVSKCGIVPVKRSVLLSVAKSLARSAVGLLPASRATLRRVASSAQFQPARTYDTRVLAESLEVSLRALDTNYLDILLLHNFNPAQNGLAEVATWLRDVRRTGRIRRFGFSVEGDLYAGLDCLARAQLLDDCVVQTPISDQLLQLPNEWRSVRFIAHSPFQFLTRQAKPNAVGSLADLFATLGTVSRCEAIVCSMFVRSHLEQNVHARDLAAGAGSIDVMKDQL